MEVLCKKVRYYLFRVVDFCHSKETKQSFINKMTDLNEKIVVGKNVIENKQIIEEKMESVKNKIKESEQRISENEIRLKESDKIIDEYSDEVIQLLSHNKILSDVNISLIEERDILRKHLVDIVYYYRVNDMEKFNISIDKSELYIKQKGK